MTKPLRKYFLIIVLIFLLPTLFFSIYEIGALRENEKVIEEIYNNQLDAILFSINQYSEDVISNWADLVESCLISTKSNQDSCLKNLMGELPSISSIYLYNREQWRLSSPKIHNEEPISLKNLKAVLAKEDTSLSRLQFYYKEGYQKIISFPLSESELVLAFSIKQNEEINFVLLIQNSKKFITEVLDPRIQQIAQDKFIIAVAKSGSDSIIYNSDQIQVITNTNHWQNFWLMPAYSMAIELKDATITKLVRSRSRKNLLLLGVIDLVLFLGIWLIYRNIKKQVELSQLKSDFVSNVSHEIRTPLALITMYIETLEMGRVKSIEKVQEYYKVIHQETHRLTAIVNKILSFSKIESGKREYVFEKTHINSIVEEVLHSYSIRLNNEGFTCKIDLHDNLPEILADKEAVTDALINLIDNAIKYSDQKKHIDLQTYIEKFHILISVRDQGIGINEHDQKHIFDKFYRVTEKNKALKAKGSGLGLSIVKHIMDAHRGSISINSNKGEGTCFILHFPIQ